MVGTSIRIIRQAKRMTASQLAAKADISVGFLSLVESGKRDVSVAVLQRISDALGVPLETLVLLSVPGDTSLETENRAANHFVSAVRNLAEAERKLSALFGEDKGSKRAARRS